MPPLADGYHGEATYRPLGLSMSMKRIAQVTLWLQVGLFILGTVYLAWAFWQAVLAGAGFVPGFETIEKRRLIAMLAPYLALPFSVLLTVLLLRVKRYGTAVSVVVCIVTGALIAGRAYLRNVPDPIVDNFGTRPQPYSGYLVLPSDKVPDGFHEVSHHYTKSEYNVRFRRTVDAKSIDLEIFESPITKFVVDEANFIQKFEYQGIVGRVYASHNGKRQELSLNLVWLNPPQQRVAIYVTQPEGSNDYSADDLVYLLQSMRAAP